MYMLLTWMLAVSTSWWISVPRYIMVMFPMFILMGLISKKKIVTWAIAGVFLAGLCFFTVLFTIGMWAFWTISKLNALSAQLCYMVKFGLF